MWMVIDDKWGIEWKHFDTEEKANKYVEYLRNKGISVHVKEEKDYVDSEG